MSVKLINTRVRELRDKFDINSIGYTIVSPDVETIQTFGDVDENSMWQIASMSKNLSATCLMWMMNDDEVSLSSKIKTVKFSDDLITKTVTIRDCMSHTTGLPPQAGRNLTIYGYEIDKIYRSLKYHPNNGYRTVFNYNDIGYTLGFQRACELIETNDVDMLDRFFKKSGMTSTSADICYYKDKIVTQYDVNGNSHKYNKAVGQVIPAGGIATTLTDLSTYLKLHLEHVSWIPCIHKMYIPVVRSSPPNQKYYGIGTSINKILDSVVYYHEGLLTSGVSTIVMYDIKNQIGISIVSNTVNPCCYAIAEYAYYLLRGESESSAYKASEISLTRDSELILSLGCKENNVKNDTCSNILNGEYWSKQSGRIIISNGYIKIGYTKPAKLSFNGHKFTFIFYDINNEKNVGEGKMIYYDDRVVGLNMLLDCDYSIYIRRSNNEYINPEYNHHSRKR